MRRLSVLVVAAVAACGGDAAGPAAKPAAVTPGTSNVSTGVAGLALATAPTFTVTDASGKALTGVSVTVAVTAGGGTLVGAPTKTSSGPTSVGQWQLGQVKGTNTVTITVAGLTPFTLSVTGVAGPAAKIAGLTSGVVANAGITLGGPFRAQVQDQFGNGVAGATVTWVNGGGGSFAAGAPLTVTADADGIANSPVYTMGKRAVLHVVQATSTGFTTTMNASVATNYDLVVRTYGPTMTAQQLALFTSASDRIRAIITGDVVDASTPTAGFNLETGCGITGVTAFNETVDDIVVYASVTAIDGVGGVLGRAGPCLRRNAASGFLTAVGIMEFDSADIQNLINLGVAEDVILHEMLHTLGIGTIWSDRSFLTGAGTAGVAYTGARARESCNGFTGVGSICAASIPVENTGGSGTRDSHWRESVFVSELMTGFANTGGMPFSRMTVGGLEDLNYQVNYAAADNYAMPSVASLMAATSLRALSMPEYREILLKPAFEISSDGRIRRIPR
ncbi:MAG: hypothetical protein K2X99_09465 [Gemmatimonadaceae bacterium]|nr:hypothetical protein [Gemmatimonadaceae bacterium]